jgi:tetratricopeptide (TPR) repeat protein
MMDVQTHYQVLRLTSNASPNQIKNAFRQLARQYHPDLNPNTPEADAAFRRISLAYEVLSNPSQRIQYDLELKRSYSMEPAPASAGGALQREFQKCYALGINQVSQKNYPAAIAEFSRAIALNPTYLEAYMGRCQARFALGDDQGVLEDCRRILLMNPQTAQAHFFQGRAHQRLGLIECAVEDYSKAIFISKDYAKAYYHRGLALLDRMEKPSAVRDLLHASKIFQKQNNTSSYQRVKATLQDIHGSPTELRTVDLQLDIGSWFSGLAVIPKIVCNPTQELLPSFESLLPLQALITGVLSAAIAIGFAMLSMAISWFNVWNIPLFGCGLLGCIAFGTLWTGHTLSRTIAGKQSHWTGDVFLAGVALLPAGGWFLFSGIGALLGNAVLLLMAVFAICSTVLLLHTGYTQIHHLSEQSAILIVPSILSICLVVVLFTGRYVLGIPFFLNL